MDEKQALLKEVGILTAEGWLATPIGALKANIPDFLLDDLWRLAFALRAKYIEDDNILDWVTGSSPYLRDQSPLRLLLESEEGTMEYSALFDLIFEAAMAWATAMHPEEFLEEHPDFV